MAPPVPDSIRFLLEEKARLYNSPAFIDNDPVQIPHSFGKQENIEISGFMASMLAWGRRDIIIKNTKDLMGRMDNDPIDFLLHMEESDLRIFTDFRHRTFNGEDCVYFIRSLQRLYRSGAGLSGAFRKGYKRGEGVRDSIAGFREEFFKAGLPGRSSKHIADPLGGSAAKRINLFLRWMVRQDKAGVDFGLWKWMNQGDLHIPLDVHTGNMARKLGLLTRRQNDWKSVEELTATLRGLDPEDPVKYDYALFGMGIFENRSDG